MFQQERSDLWLKEKHIWDKEAAFLGYNKTVGAALSFALDQLHGNNPDALSVLATLAFLAPDDIPKRLFEAPGKAVGTELNDVRYTSAIAALRGKSLINTSEDSLSVHRLVQFSTQDYIAADRTKWLQAAASLVECQLAAHSVSHDDWPFVVRLAPHAARLANTLRAGDVPKEMDRVARSLICGVASVYARVGRLVEARDSYFDELKLQHDDPGRADTLSELGLIQRRLGNLREASKCYVEALNLYSEAGRRDNCIHVLCGLGMVSEQAGDLKEAALWFDRMGGQVRRDSDKRIKAKFLHCRGRIRARTNPAQAMKDYRQSATLYRASNSAADRNSVLLDHARLLMDHRPSVASRLAQEALESYRRLANTPGVAASSVNLGIILAALGRRADATRYWEQAREMLRALVPEQANWVNREGDRGPSPYWVNWLSMYDPAYQRAELNAVKRLLGS